MAQLGSVCFHPSRPEFDGGRRAGVTTSNCSATAAAFPWIHQEIKRLTPRTPPVFSGTVAGQFAANLNPVKRSGWPTVSASPKICPEIINIWGECSTAALGGKRAGEGGGGR